MLLIYFSYLALLLVNVLDMINKNFLIDLFY